MALGMQPLQHAGKVQVLQVHGCPHRRTPQYVGCHPEIELALSQPMKAVLGSTPLIHAYKASPLVLTCAPVGLTQATPPDRVAVTAVFAVGAGESVL